jgi:ribose-phosphate pyrophosphokinase
MSRMLLKPDAAGCGSMTGIVLFALSSSRPYGERLARRLEIPLAEHEERPFEDGEHKLRPLREVRGEDVFVLDSLHAEPRLSVNDKLCRLLFFIGAVKDAGASRVTAVVPYLCYARKDQRTNFQDPVTTRYVAALFEAVGTDRMMTIDVHNVAAFQNAFRCPTDHLEATPLFASHFAELVGDQELVVVSPDIGGVKRAERFRQALAMLLHREPAAAFVEKFRHAGVLSGGTLVGDVTGRTAIVLDDLISTGNTLRRVAKACREGGARGVYAAATHGLFVGAGKELWRDPIFDALVATDTVPQAESRSDPQRLTVLDSTRLLSESIHAAHAL